MIARLVVAQPMQTDPIKRPAVEGLPVDVMCIKCNTHPVLMVYQRCASSVMFCAECGSVWTVSAATQGRKTSNRG
jgi:hypothetical protein